MPDDTVKRSVSQSSADGGEDGELVGGPAQTDEFGLAWIGAIQDEPAVGYLKTCQPGTLLACYCTDGLVVGKLNRCNQRSSTGVTFLLDDVVAYPGTLLARVRTTGGWMHLCRNRPCRREETTSTYQSKQ